MILNSVYLSDYRKLKKWHTPVMHFYRMTKPHDVQAAKRINPSRIVKCSKYQASLENCRWLYAANASRNSTASVKGAKCLSSLAKEREKRNNFNAKFEDFENGDTFCGSRVVAKSLPN